MLNEEERAALIRVARESIEGILEGHYREWRPVDFGEALRRPAGAFVTLTKHEDLRGCIGSIEPVAPLVIAVGASAVNAAFRDPRFDPVTPEEYPEISVEISVMGPITPVRNIEEILVGRDGLIVTRGHYSGLLLPQVATEYGWSREIFLSQTCVKAGLPPSAWSEPGTLVSKFSAEVFDE